jgi:hypothetical protein
MKIQFVTPKRVEKNVKSRVNLLKTGKLSFNQRIRKVYEITKDTYFKIGVNADNPNDISLYLQKCSADDPNARKIHKSGEQLILTVSFALNQLGVDYANKKYLAALEEVALQGEKYMKISFTSI